MHMESVRDGFAAVRGNIDSGIRRASGSLASGGPLGGAGSSSSSRLQADEDIELPILEATTALSDGCGCRSCMLIMSTDPKCQRQLLSPSKWMRTLTYCPDKHWLHCLADMVPLLLSCTALNLAPSGIASGVAPDVGKIGHHLPDAGNINITNKFQTPDRRLL